MALLSLFLFMELIFNSQVYIHSLNVWAQPNESYEIPEEDATLYLEDGLAEEVLNVSVKTNRTTERSSRKRDGIERISSNRQRSGRRKNRSDGGGRSKKA